MEGGLVPVSVRDGVGGHDAIFARDIPVGATVDQLSSVERIIESMDRAGIDKRLLTPPPFTYRYWDDPEQTANLCRIINDATAAVVDRYPDRFAALATVPVQSPERAIAEFRRCVDDLGMLGLGVGTNVGGRLLSDSEFRPLFRTVADAGMPVLVHPDFVASPRYADYYLINVIGMPVETGTTVANMMLTGMLDELAELRVCFVHGGGIAPFLLGRWTKSWQSRGDTSKDSNRPPMEYLKNLYFDSLTHSTESLAFLIQLVGSDHVVLGTDAPFDVEESNPIGVLRSTPRMTPEAIEQVMCLSPQEWLFGQPRR